MILHMWVLKHSKVKLTAPWPLNTAAVFVSRPNHKAKALTSIHTHPEGAGEGARLHPSVHRVHLILSEGNLPTLMRKKAICLMTEFRMPCGASTGPGS